MLTFNLKNWKFLMLGITLSAVLGCASGKSYDYEPTAGEMKPGPGVFTGESGEFTVYDSKKGGLFPKKAAPEAEKTTAAAAQAGQEATESPPDAEDFKEFQEFQQWKKEKQEFREYQEWKEWKSYQEWKKRKGE